MSEENGYWGKFSDKNQPIVRYDPLQSRIINGERRGFRLHINPSRGNKPRDQITQRNESHPQANTDSILFKISNGEEKAIFIAGDEKILGSPEEEPVFQNVMGYKGLAIINRYSPVNFHAIEDPGVALVCYSNTHSEHLDRKEPIKDILTVLKTASIHLLTKDVDMSKILQTSIIFMNIGSSSGASLRQLHAQVYFTDKLHGDASWAFFDAYKQNSECLVCKLANNKHVIDHLGQKINIQDLIIWEDDNVRLVHPFAPIRPFSLRIYIKEHISWIGEISNQMIESISLAMQTSYIVLRAILPKKWDRILDRSISFRQSENIDTDYHMFIDLMSTIPVGASELVDSLSISSLDPHLYAKLMRNVLVKGE